MRAAEGRRPRGRPFDASSRRLALSWALCVATSLCHAWPAASQTPASETGGAIALDGEPLRCWWRTSTPAIRIGETFSVILTCAAEDTSGLSVIADESRLSGDAVALAPFEVLDGVRGADVRDGDHRFFQYHYHVRLLSDTLFGADAVVPPVTISYRTQSRTADGTTTEGMERNHQLPSLAVRVLSLVPADARDIREAPVRTLAELDSAAFRARMMITGGGALLGVGGLMLAVALVTRVARRRGTTPAALTALSEAMVLSAAGEELAAIRPHLQGGGWTPALAGRALGALRIAGAPLLSRRAAQRRTDSRTNPDGGLVREGPGGRILISSAITPDTVLRHRQSLLEEETPPDRLRKLDELYEALTSLTRASYGAEGSFAELGLDDVLTFGEGLVASELREHRWLARQWQSISQTGRRLVRRA